MGPYLNLIIYTKTVMIQELLREPFSPPFTRRRQRWVSDGSAVPFEGGTPGEAEPAAVALGTRVGRSFAHRRTQRSGEFDLQAVFVTVRWKKEVEVLCKQSSPTRYKSGN